MIASLLNRLRARPQADACATMAQAFRGRLRQWSRIARSTGRGERVAVLVAPWMETAVPLYSLEWALRLDKAGFKVEVLWDSANFFGGNSSNEQAAVLQTLQRLPRQIVVQSVENIALSNYDLDRSLVEKLLFENKTRSLGREPDEPISSSDPTYRSFFFHAKRVLDCLKAGDYAWILVPGGVWGVTGLYWNACIELGIGLTTYDSGAELICLHHGGPAAHFPDVIPAIRLLWNASESSAKLWEEIRTWSLKRLSVREAGDDEFGLQPKSGNLSMEFDVVVPLNYRVDSAAMCRQRLFQSVNQWIRALVEWAQNRASVRIAFRQHPCEKLEAYRSKEDYNWINDLGNPRIRFISAVDPINTYDLIRRCRVVAPYCSRVGIEAALLGKPVVAAANCYYDSLEFANKPGNTTDYLAMLDDLVANGTELTPEEQRLAAVAYFVIERFTLLKTGFTPIPDDFWSWVRKKPDELWRDFTVNCLFESACSRKPLSLISLERFLAQRKSESLGVRSHH
jgi:hypothetical protein